ncbi:MAG: peptidoglycan D,D-transpeptidase FtsI family protein [Acidimicrobiia bacterium]
MKKEASPKRRLVGVLCVSVLVFAVIGIRLVDVQGLGRERYARLGLDQRLQTIELAAERGSIFDRNGSDLAVSVQQQTVFADARVIEDPGGYAAALAPLVGVAQAELALKLSQRDKAFVYIARKVNDDVAGQVLDLDLPGIHSVPESARFYPSNALAGPLLGFVGTDNNGLGGLEAGYEDLLAGKPGEVVVERDPQGREIPNGERSVEPSQRGDDLVLTIDQSLQYETERVLMEGVTAANAKAGTAIVMDVQTGDILTMATVEGPTAGQPARPAPPSERNRPVTDVYEPGSTNKVITVAGAIEDGTVTPDTWFDVPSQITVDDEVFKDVDAHPTAMTVADIVRRSSNVGTIFIARQLGQERFDAYLRAFGFGSLTGVGFPGESSGIVLPLAEYSDTSLASMPVGSGLAVTALQMLNVYTTLANDGATRPPRLVAATIGADGTRTEQPTAASQLVVSPETAATMRQLLEAVVAGGTGTRAAIPGYRVAGKTGTARKPPYTGAYVASFAGFAPADAPRLATIVVLDEPGKSIYGGEVAAPVFSQILQYALRLERVPPSDTTAAGADPVATAAASLPPGSLNDSP